MSKLKVNQIETKSNNLKLAPKGTGLVKVKGAGGADGTLQLNSSNNTYSVKIKSPDHSSGQSYTMILPDNNIEAGKFLKVKSITGSGATATGQLEYATIATADLLNLNADNLTSGNLPTARFPSSFPAADAGLEFISKSSVGSTAVSEITISGFNEGMYLLIGKNISFDGNTYINMYPLQSDGTAPTGSDLTMESWYLENDSTTIDSNTSQSQLNRYVIGIHGMQTDKMGLIMEINNTASLGTVLVRGMRPQYDDNKIEMYGSWRVSNKRIYSLKLEPDSGNFTQDTQFLLYKYGVS